jgi:hypothetical protein
MNPEPTQSELNIIGGIYRSGARDLAGLLKGTDFQRGKASVLLRQVDEISRTMAGQSDHWVTKTVRGKIDASAQAITRKLDPVAQKIGGEDWTVARPEFLKINERAVRVFSRQLAVDLAKKNQEITTTARRLISTTAQKVISDPELSATIAKGLVAGGSLNNIAKSVQARLAEGGKELLDSGKYTPEQLKEICDFDAGFIQAGKARMRIGDYAELVAHYQLRQAATESTKERMGDIGESLGDREMFDLVIVTGPASANCDICDAIVGNVYSISGNHAKYPGLATLPNGGPPFHPHCTHNLAPYIADLN